jgi:hypothetical protein
MKLSRFGTSKAVAAAAVFALAVSPLLAMNLPSAFASTKSAPAVITCNKTMTGINDAVINVAAPLTYCLVDLSQIGAVNVAPGAGLSVSGGSTINGAITATAPKVFSFCGSATKQGAILVVRSAGYVSIGNGGVLNVLCGANTINGATTLSGNLGGVELGGNAIVGGSLTVSGNIAATAAEIDGNVVQGLTTCANNSPKPVNDGRKNTFTGGVNGQCAGL